MEEEYPVLALRVSTGKVVYLMNWFTVIAVIYEKHTIATVLAR